MYTCLAPGTRTSFLQRYALNIQSSFQKRDPLMTLPHLDACLSSSKFTLLIPNPTAKALSVCTLFLLPCHTPPSLHLRETPIKVLILHIRNHLGKQIEVLILHMGIPFNPKVQTYQLCYINFSSFLFFFYIKFSLIHEYQPSPSKVISLVNAASSQSFLNGRFL